MKCISIILILCLGIVIYSNTFHCSFHFDDLYFILDNNALKNIHNLQNIWKYLPCRFLFYLSLALNYHFHQFDVFGYHLVNLGIHLVSAILVWWLVLLTFSTPAMKDLLVARQSSKQGEAKNKITQHADIIALFAGLVFVSHPVQTQAVTYIMQRAASMATMFYVASLCFYIKSRLLSDVKPRKSPGALLTQRIFYIASLITTIIAMYTKEITITLPLMVVFYEFCFFSAQENLKWSSLWTFVVTRKYLIPFLITLLIIPVTMFFTHNDSINSKEIQGAMQGTTDISSEQYILTQFRVIVTYIRLIFLALNQNVDYDYHITKSFFELPTLISFLFLVIIIFFAIRLFSKYRLVSFSIFWFFLTLLPESSLFPIKDVIFEHRLYLPLVGYSIFLVSGVYYLFGKKIHLTMILILSMIIACNSILTYQRNKVWKNEYTLWNDAVIKSPNKARPYINRGLYYYDHGEYIQALSDYNKAITLNPNFAEGYNNRGIVYNKQGHFSQAVSDFNKALEIDPKFTKIYLNLGVDYNEQGNVRQAIIDYNKAIELSPNLYDAYYNLGIIYAKEGNVAQAMSDYNKAIEIDPKSAEAYNNRGNIQGNQNQAMSDFNNALELNPSYDDAYTNRGIVYAKQGNLTQAIINFTKAIEINPKQEQAYNNRGSAYESQSNFKQAVVDYSKAIEINPKDAGAYYNRGGIYINKAI